MYLRRTHTYVLWLQPISPPFSCDSLSLVDSFSFFNSLGKDVWACACSMWACQWIPPGGIQAISTKTLRHICWLCSFQYHFTITFSGTTVIPDSIVSLDRRLGLNRGDAPVVFRLSLTTLLRKREIKVRPIHTLVLAAWLWPSGNAVWASRNTLSWRGQFSDAWEGAEARPIFMALW